MLNKVASFCFLIGTITIYMTQAQNIKHESFVGEAFVDKQNCFNIKPCFLEWKKDIALRAALVLAISKLSQQNPNIQFASSIYNPIQSKEQVVAFAQSGVFQVLDIEPYWEIPDQKIKIFLTAIPDFQPPSEIMPCFSAFAPILFTDPALLAEAQKKATLTAELKIKSKFSQLVDGLKTQIELVNKPNGIERIHHLLHFGKMKGHLSTDRLEIIKNKLQKPVAVRLSGCIRS